MVEVGSSNAHVEFTKGEMKGSRAQVMVSDAELNGYCPVKEKSEKETTTPEIPSSESTAQYTYPSPEPEEEKSGICGTGTIIVFALFATALRRR